MPEVTTYAAGAPCWSQLHVPVVKQQIVLDFNCGLFGWKAEHGPANRGGYTLFELDGKAVGSPFAGSRELPAPKWVTYLASAREYDPKAARAGWRQTAGLRPRGLRGPQRGRTLLRPPQAVPRDRHPLRQTRRPLQGRSPPRLRSSSGSASAPNVCRTLPSVMRQKS